MRRPLLGLVLLAASFVGCGGGGGTTTNSAPDNGANGAGGGTSYSILYASNYTSRTADAYRLNTADSTLTAFAGSPFQTVPSPDFASAITADPLGRFLYVLDGGADRVVPSVGPSIRSFRVDRQSGALTQTGKLAIPPVSFLVAHPNGGMLYAVVQGNYAGQSGAILSFQVDQTNGALAPASAISMDVPYSIATSAAVEPSGRYLFTIGPRTLDMNDQGTTVVTYAINGAALTRVSTFDVTPYGGRGPGPFAVSSDFAFVSEGAFGPFRVARINGDGSLSLVFDSSAIQGQLQTDSFVVSPDGARIYLHNPLQNTLESWSVDSGGTMHPVSSNPVGFIVDNPEFAVSKDGRMLLMMNSFQTLYSYAVDTSGNIEATPATQHGTSDPQQWTNMALVE